VATIAEPLLQSLFPPSGALKPSVGDALAALPDAWWLRAPFMMVALVLAMALGRVRPLRRHGRPTAAIGCGAALAAMLGLSLTSHAASRDSWRALTTGSVILHEWSVGLWVGGLVCLALLRPGRSGGAETGGGRDPVRVFSTYALPLVAVGVLTGAVNAGFILPSLHALWQSDYGRVLIAKVAILVPALALATVHRARLRDLASTAAATLRASVRIETAVVAAVVLGGTVLSLLAPPATAKTGSAASVDLAAPLVGDAPNEDLYARLTVAPAKPGDNTVSVLVTEGQPLAFGATGGLVPRPTLTTIALARVTFTSLDQDAAPVSTELTRGADGVFTGSGGALSMTGWYRADVLVRRDGVQDAGVDFYMLLPDPNVSGFDAGPRPASDPAARALFDRGRLALTSLHSVAFVERLGGGTGTVVTSAQRVSDGTDGRSPSLSIFTPDTEMIRIGSAQWVNSPGDPWNKSASGPVVPPSDWGSDYDAATAFHLGRIDDVNGIAAQIVTIFVPGTSLAPAWYAWWIEPATGHLLRETMVSRGHYMEREFSDFDQPQPISPPDQSATPAPAATPR
ncbi:MAG: copper resistance D family protein, partial [Thermomicrobiales bacterium]